MGDDFGMFSMMLLLFGAPIAVIAVTIKALLLIRKQEFKRALQLWGVMVFIAACLALVLWKPFREYAAEIKEGSETTLGQE